MIEMYIENSQLVLTEDLSIRIELNFPAFESDSIPASIVYQFDIPQRGNEEILNYANHIEVLGKYQEYDWKMKYFGIPLFAGKLVILSVSSDSFRCAAILRQLSSDFSEKNISDFPFETQYLVPPGTTIQNSAYIETVYHEMFSLPKIYAPELLQSNPDFSGMVNRFPSNEQGKYSETAIPVFYVFKILEKIFESENFGIDYYSSATAFMNSLFKSLSFFNNYTLDSSLHEENPSTLSLSYYQNEINPQNHLPEVSVNNLLLTIKQMFGALTFVDNRSAMVQIICYNDILHSSILDLTANFLDDTEISINEPVASIIKYNSDDYKITSSVTEYLSLSAVPQPSRIGQLISVRSVNSYYKSERLIDIDDKGNETIQIVWNKVGETFNSVNTNPSLSKSEEVKIDALPMSMLDVSGETLPFYKEAGYSKRFAQETSKIDKLLFLYSYNKSEYFGDNRHWGTTSDINRDGMVNSNSQSLSLKGTYGIYIKILKPWYDFLENGNEYTFNLKISLEDMLRIIPIFGYQDVQSQLQFRRVRIKNQIYIPKQFTFELSHTKITCQAKLMKNDGDN